MIEVTRKCNLKCKHCMRGDAQDLNISKKIIDNLLDQVVGIENLFLTGGEPLLADDEVEYIVDEIIRRNMVIRELSFVTNGTVLSDKMVNTLDKINTYIKNLNKNIFNVELNHNVTVFISKDRYHNTNTDELKQNFIDKLDNIATVGYCYNGESVTKKGRGSFLNCGREITYQKPCRVCIYGEGYKCYCMAINQYAEGISGLPEIPIVCCELYLTTKGILLPSINVNDTFDNIDGLDFSIADLNNPVSILDGIDKYNEEYPDLCFDSLDDFSKRQNEIDNESVENLYNRITNYNINCEIEKEESTHIEEQNKTYIEMFEHYTYGEDLEKNQKSIEKYGIDEVLKFNKGIFFYGMKHKDENESKAWVLQKYYNKPNLYRVYPFLEDEELKQLQKLKTEKKRNTTAYKDLVVKNYKRYFENEWEKFLHKDEVTLNLLKAFEMVLKDNNYDYQKVFSELNGMMFFGTFPTYNDDGDKDGIIPLYTPEELIELMKNVQDESYVENFIKNNIARKFAVYTSVMVMKYMDYFHSKIDKDYLDKVYEYIGFYQFFTETLEKLGIENYTLNDSKGIPRTMKSHAEGMKDLYDFCQDMLYNTFTKIKLLFQCGEIYEGSILDSALYEIGKRNKK